MSRKSVFRRWWRKLKSLAGGHEFLCDTCRLDYRHGCRNPDHPNATDCDEYEKR